MFYKITNFIFAHSFLPRTATDDNYSDTRHIALIRITQDYDALGSSVRFGMRASLARALVNGPGVLLADEPTGNLDRPNAELVFQSLRKLADTFGVAVVMVTHNESPVSYATRAVRLTDGRFY